MPVLSDVKVVRGCTLHISVLSVGGVEGHKYAIQDSGLLLFWKLKQQCLILAEALAGF